MCGVSSSVLGVALFGTNVSERLSSSREELPVSMIIFSWNGFRTSA